MTTQTTQPNTAPDRDTTQAIRLSIDQIHCYSGNPRRQANPEYARIKASIRREGLDQPLVVTQKPGETDYLLQAGGNTRLQILKALYRETGEERFLRIDCLLKPWREESAVLLAHLRENELRGELPFIDKALAVFEAKRLFEGELRTPDISQRQLALLLKEHGFPLGNAVISKMGYSVHRLLPLIPQALEAGLGRPQVEKIRALERAATRLWTEKGLGDEAAFSDTFATLCRRYDAPDWELEALRNALENEIAETAEESLQTVRLTLGALLSGRELPLDIPEDDEEADEDAAQALPNCVDKVDSKQPTPLEQRAPAPPDPGVSRNTPQNLEAAKEHPPELDELGTLRARAYQLAGGLAQRNGLGDQLIPLPDQGLGFLLNDVPDPVLGETLDPELLGQVSMLWWQLAACAEVTVAPVELLIAHMDPQSVLYRALVNQDAALLFDSIWTLDPGQIGYQLWRQLADQDWEDLMSLMSVYRQIYGYAARTGQSLWE